MKFFLIIDLGHIYYFVAYHKIYFNSCFVVMNSICYSFGLFVVPLSLAIILRFNFIDVTILNNHIINLACLNYYSQKIDKYCFFFLYYYLIEKKKILKFSSLKKVNIIIC